MTPYYVEIDGLTIAFVAASRAEKYEMTPQATETEPGILRCYNTELFLETIREADANADLVIACVHWGTEYSTVLEDVQLTTGKQYLDTMLLLLHVTGTKENPQIEVQVVPALQENYCTAILTEEEKKRDFYCFLEEISINVQFDEEGFVKER